MIASPPKQSLVEETLDTIADNGHAERCIQCHKCSAGCPMADDMDFKPSQIVRLIQLRMTDPLKTAKAIWLCSSCHTCSDRCPAGVSLSHMQDSLRTLSINSDTKPTDRRSAVASLSILESVASGGRMNELAMMRRYKLRTGTIFERFRLGLALFIRGKLKLFRRSIKAKKKIRAMIRTFIKHSAH